VVQGQGSAGVGVSCLLWGLPEPYTYTVYDRIFCDIPAKTTVYTLYMYIFIYIWLWPTLAFLVQCYVLHRMQA